MSTRLRVYMSTLCWHVITVWSGLHDAEDARILLFNAFDSTIFAAPYGVGIGTGCNGAARPAGITVTNY